MNTLSVDFIFSREDTADFFIRFHSHNCYELVYYLSGSGYCFIDGVKHSYGEGNIVVIPSGTVHNDNHNEQTKLICVGLTSDIASQIPAGVYTDQSGKIRNYLSILLQEFQTRYNDYIEVISNIACNILIEIRRSVSEYNKKSNHEELIKQIVSYVNAYFLTDIKLQELTNTFNYSYDRCRHIFKEITGISIKQYVIKKRLEYAKELLKTTNLSVLEIAIKSGFSSSSYFIKEFEKNCKKSPSKYRNQYITKDNFIDEN